MGVVLFFTEICLRHLTPKIKIELQYELQN